MQGVCRHPSKFTHASLPRLWTSSCNFDRGVHKVCKNLDGALGVEETQGLRAVVVSFSSKPRGMIHQELMSRGLVTKAGPYFMLEQIVSLL